MEHHISKHPTNQALAWKLQLAGVRVSEQNAFFYTYIYISFFLTAKDKQAAAASCKLLHEGKIMF